MTDDASLRAAHQQPAAGSVPGHTLDTVVEVVAGTLSDGTPAAPERGARAPHLSRLCSPAGLYAGRAATADVVILGSQAEVDRFAASSGISEPGLIIVGPDMITAALPASLPVARVADVRLALARLSALFDARPNQAPGRHPTAVIDPLARVAADAGIGAGAVVAAGAVVGTGTVVGPNSVIGHGSRVGSGCVIHANVAIYDGVTLGDRVVIHAGAVIGADGFGYAGTQTGAVKIRHAGGVVLHDDVEVGANTAIDRGTIDDTVIGARTKIDNLCQVGHNVTIGSDCLIAGTAALGGSSTIGNGVIIGGNVAVSDHVTIGSGAKVAGRSGVTKDIPPGETWAGFPAVPYRRYVRSLYLGARLEQLWDYVKSAKAAGTDSSTVDDE